MSKEDFHSADSRRRIILYLIEKFLTEKGLFNVAQVLKTEAILHDYEICDNIDLETIFLEYVSFYQYKFGKYPKIYKKIEREHDMKKDNKRKSPSCPKKNILKNNKVVEACTADDLIETLQIKPVFIEGNNQILEVANDLSLTNIDIPSDWKDLTSLIINNLIKTDFGCRWEHIVGNVNAINIIKESVTLPLLHPELFSETFKPWKSVLLHGPPGGGKTLIAKTLCSETLNSVSFFNISSSTITSKWRGESEKLIKILFRVAKCYAPSIIFIDEVEGLISKRDGGFENDASFRSKNEFLSLMDGLQDDLAGVFVLANSNIPWIIDEAFLRRFEKKIFIDLPNTNERISLIQKFVQDSLKWPKEKLELLARECEGYTGDEIRIACKEAKMSKIRAISETSHNKFKTTCVDDRDIYRALKQMKPSAGNTINKHREWNNKFGTTF